MSISVFLLCRSRFVTPSILKTEAEVVLNIGTVFAPVVGLVRIARAPLAIGPGS